MNRLYRLKPQTKLLTDFYVLDIETGIKNPDGSVDYILEGRPDKFIFACIYGHNYKKVFDNIEDIKKELLLPRFKNRKVFAHNAEYDLNGIYGNIYELDNKSIFNGRFISATNGNCLFADSFNIFPTKVETLGLAIGKPKMKLGNNLHSDDWRNDIKYCFNDCEIVYECLFNTFEFAGAIKITQASLSLERFRRYHQPFTIEHNEHTKHFWDSYFGGRTEVFKKGKTNAKVIDVNSTYPFAMVNCKFPNPKYLKVLINVSVDDFLINFLNQYEGAIYCKVNHKEHYFGFLPYKSKNKLIFPTGIFSGCWNFNEIRFAIKHGIIEILDISKIVFSEPMESPFINYVETLYFERFKTTDPFEIYRVKIYMNSLYGKLAQRLDTEFIYLPNYAKELKLINFHKRKKTFIELHLFNQYRSDAFLEVKSKRKNLPYAIPSFSSYITSFSRVLLLEKLLELQNNVPVYCDTDSIFFEIDNGKFSYDNKKLGEWKLEDKIITHIHGLKNYEFIEGGELKRKLKGVPKSAVEIFPNVFEYVNLVRSKEGLRRNLDAMVKQKRIKKISGKYEKRVILEDDKQTKPINL